MLISKLQLKNFRLFSELLLEFKRQTTVLIAPNAMGKSSVVEAIRLLSIGQSFRAGKIEEMIQIDRDLGRVRAKIHDNISSFKENLEIADELVLAALITRGEVNGKRTRKLLFSVNDNRRQKKKFVGQLLTVVFRPEDMRLIEGSPGRRRDYLDSLLVLTDYEYSTSLDKYNKALRRRNRLLSLIKENKQDQEVLTYWDMALTKHGERLQKRRRSLIKFVNSQVEQPLPMKINYKPSLISKKRIQDHRTAEIATGFTLIGPHKDDFEVMLDLQLGEDGASSYKALDAYGSRGQKRMGVIWLKKAELVYLKHKTNKLPILILDDILSELDKDNREKVLDLIDGEQIIITTVNQDLVKEVEQKLGQVEVIRLAEVLQKS
jgi:DNA replication and repair protein RecF